VQVLCSEGLANHTGPEPCVVACEGNGEASARERAGQVLSPENYYFRNADALPIVEGNTDPDGRRKAPTRGAVRPPPFRGGRDHPRNFSLGKQRSPTFCADEDGIRGVNFGSGGGI